MQVKKLFIIGILCNGEDKDEIMGSAKALWNKYAAVGDKALIHVDASQMDRRGAFDERKIRAEIVHSQGSVSDADGEQNVGVYLVGHGYDIAPAGVGNFNAQALADLIHWFEPQAIRKLCMVVCSAGRPEDRLEGNPSLLQKFCAALAGHKLTPMIAGWERFVTVCRPGLGGTIRKTNSSYYTEEELAPMYGKKIASRDSNRKIVRPGGKPNETLMAMKQVYVWRGEVATPANDGWSDKA